MQVSTLATGIHASGPGTIRILEQSYTAFTVGAKDFTPPQGLGIFTSHDCYIGIARRGPKPDLVSVFNLAKPDFIAGARVWSWSIPPFEGYPRSTFFMLPKLPSHIC